MFLLKRMIFFVELIKIAFCSSGAVVKTPLEVTHIAWIQVYFAPYNYYLGIVEFGLFGKMYPKTVRNFVELANVRKFGAGLNMTQLLVAYDFVTGGLFKGRACTIYGRFYEGEELYFAPHGLGWLSGFSVESSLRLTSMFSVSILDSAFSGHTYGKVIRGMAIMENIRFLYDNVKQRELKSEFYITDCGAYIPQKKFYISMDGAPFFI